MAMLRTHIVLPRELAKEIDELVGPRMRSAFIVETTAKEVRRRKLLAFLESGSDTAWQDENHSDLAAMGTAEWVRAQRGEPSVRLAERDENLDPQ
jgi:hypothetical protein